MTYTECCEITITVKDDEKTLRTKHLIYDPVTVSSIDPIIKNCIDETIKNFNADTNSDLKVTVSIKLEVK